MADMKFIRTKVRIANERELQLDLDSELAVSECFSMLAFFRSRGFTFWNRIHLRQSKSPGHFHIYVRLAKPIVSNVERILLQTLLHSDPHREARSYCRAKNRARWPILLIEPDDEPGLRKIRGSRSR